MATECGREQCSAAHLPLAQACSPAPPLLRPSATHACTPRFGQARAAVARIGLDTMTSPYWAHELLLWLQMLIPDAAVGPALLSMHKVRVRVRVT